MRNKWRINFKSSLYETNNSIEVENGFHFN